MKKELAVSCASVLVFLLAAVTASAYVTNNFNTGLIDSSWQNSSSAVISNSASPLTHEGAGSLFIPIRSTATNVTGSGSAASEKKVWTDFYTIPRPFYSDTLSSPVVDTNATAQFFVNTNGLWVTISGNGTNVCRTVINPSGATYPTVTQYTAFYHVSVLHDYTNLKWSLFVNDLLLATNLSFIASGVTAHTWFQVQNLGGSSNDVCWLDDFLVANKVPASGANALTNTVPGTTVPVSDALAGFGSISDPRPTNQTVGVVVGGVNLSFGRLVADGRTYTMLGSSNYNLSGLASNGAVVAGSFTDTGWGASDTRRYYKLITVSPDGGIAVTNDETYAAYKQARTKNSIYYVGGPVDPRDGDRTVGGTLGAQLASGLATGDKMYIYFDGVGTPEEYTIDGAGNWSVGNTSKVIPLGQGVMIRRLSGTGAATTNAFLAGTVPTNASPVTIYPGFNIVSWPYAAAGSMSTAGKFTGITRAGVGTINDYFYMQNNSSSVKYGHFDASGVWKAGFDLGTPNVFSEALQPGAAIVIFHSGANGQWNP